MSLAEIEKAACSRNLPARESIRSSEFGVGALSPDELACLAAYIARQDKLARSASRTDSSRGENEQLEQDFSPGGKQPL
jgi:hypothetical protein